MVKKQNRDKSGKFASGFVEFETTPKKVKTKKKLTLVAIVLDRSGSMYNIARSTVNAYNSILEGIRQSTKAEGQDSEVSLVTFSYAPSVDVPLTNVDSVPNLSNLHCTGGTALFDSVEKAVQVLSASPKANDPETSFLVVSVTDGEENSSVRVNASQLRTLMNDKQVTGKWTFAFNLPRGYRERFVRTFGVPEENCREWEANDAGIAETQRATNVGLQSFFSARSAGAHATKNFYADMSKVKSSDLKKDLVDVGQNYKSYTVESESPINSFVEAKTGKSYKAGSAFYALTKQEKIQPNKQVLIVDKDTKKVWGGSKARALLGLPTDGVTEAKVTPHNLSKYDVYIQSTSSNRVLVRGTKVLVSKS